MTASGEVVYKAEKDACRAFPDPQGDGLATGPKRNFQILSPLDFLAEFTQHIPPKGAHLVRYYGWYSNKARGMRRKAAAAEAAASNLPSPSGRGAGGEGCLWSCSPSSRSPLFYTQHRVGLFPRSLAGVRFRRPSGQSKKSPSTIPYGHHVPAVAG